MHDLVHDMLVLFMFFLMAGGGGGGEFSKPGSKTS